MACNTPSSLTTPFKHEALLVPVRARHAVFQSHRSQQRRGGFKIASLKPQSSQKLTDAFRLHWPQFQQQVSGEWEGTSTTFSADGSPEQLPEHYVPQAYRDWAVELYDWQTQCSSLATDSVFQVTSRKLMPTVGCEADAVAFTEDGVKLWSAEDSTPVLPILPSGSYSHGPQQLPTASTKFSIETCLQQCSDDGSSRSRVRTVHHISRHWQTKQWRVSSIDLYQDQWEGPYRGKRELLACGYGGKGFGKQQPLAVEQLQGSWRVADGMQYSSTGDGECAAAALAQGQPLAVEAAGAVMLPLGVWSRVTVEGENVSVEAGRVVADGRLLYAQRSYGEGQLAAVVLAEAAR